MLKGEDLTMEVLRRTMALEILIGFIVMLNLHGCTAKVDLEPDLVSWDEAESLCVNMGYQLFPGRKFRAKDITNALAEGQAAWLNGWRVLTDVDRDTKGRVKTLKVDISRHSDPRSFVCKTSTGDFLTSADTLKSTVEASKRCIAQGNELATLNTENDIRVFLASVTTDQPLWTGGVTTQVDYHGPGTFMKQCLAVRKIGGQLKYVYETCNTELSFICFKDTKRFSEFSTLVSKKLTRYEDVQEIVQQGATLTQSSTQTMEEPTSSVMSLTSSSVDTFITPTSVITSSESLALTSTMTSSPVNAVLPTSSFVSSSDLLKPTSTMTSSSVNAVLPTSSLVTSSELREPTSTMSSSSVDPVLLPSSFVSSSELREPTSTMTSSSVNEGLTTSSVVTSSEVGGIMTTTASSSSVNLVLPTSSLVTSSELQVITSTTPLLAVDPVLLTSSVVSSSDLRELTSTMASSSVTPVLLASSAVSSSELQELTSMVSSSSSNPVLPTSSVSTSSELPVQPESTESVSPSMIIETSSEPSDIYYYVDSTDLFGDDLTDVPAVEATEVLTPPSSSPMNVPTTETIATSPIETMTTAADQMLKVSSTSTSATDSLSIGRSSIQLVTYPSETQTTATLDTSSDAPHTTIGDHIQYTVSSVLQSVSLSSSSEPYDSFFDKTVMPDTEETTEPEHVPHTDPPPKPETTSSASPDVGKPTSTTVAPVSKPTIPVIDIKPTTTYRQPESTSVQVDVGIEDDLDVEDDTKKDTDDGVINETDNQRGTVETSDEGWDAGIWVAFIILIIAVCVSLIIAFILYRRKRRSKSEPISTSNGPVPTVNETELREKRSKSLSPPRESTTFNDKSYDL